MKIVCVDDQRVFLKTLIKQLEHLGYRNVQTMESCDEVAKLLEHDSEVALVMADLHIPHRSGMDLLKWVRSHKARRIHEMPFLMVSGDDHTGTVHEAIHAGATGYLMKPLGLEALRSQLERIAKL